MFYYIMEHKGRETSLCKNKWILPTPIFIHSHLVLVNINAQSKNAYYSNHLKHMTNFIWKVFCNTNIECFWKILDNQVLI